MTTSPLSRIANCNAMPEGAWRLATWRACVLPKGHEGKEHQDEDGNTFVVRERRFVTVVPGSYVENQVRR